MAKRLLLLRHGLTAWNADGRFQGRADVELTETGHQQAKTVARTLAELEPAGLWTSDLSRAATTAAYIGEAAGLAPTVDVRLREAHVGAFQGIDHAEARERFGPGPWDYGQHGGESEAEVGTRFAAAVADAVAQLAPGTLGICVSHGHAIKVGLTAALGWPVSLAGDLAGMDNCAWAELRIANDGAVRLVAYNRVTPIS